MGSGGAAIGGGGTGFGGNGCLSRGANIPAEQSSISDFEMTIDTHAVEPGGSWISESDGTGILAMSFQPCGTTGDGLRLVGRGHTVWGAMVSASFSADMRSVDASRFRGISFTVRSQMGGVAVLVRLQNPDSVAAYCECVEGDIAEECHAGYVVTVVTPSVATPIVLPWASFGRTAWGHHAPGQTTIDPSQLVGIEFGFENGVDFDVCFDDVRFMD